MPITTTSTGATYGKSSDPLCPLGFHPQVRWPTRCKRCFRDYKEHSDDNDRARFSNLSRNAAEDTGDHWATPGRRQGFQKSRSLDVSALSESKFRSDAGRLSNTCFCFKAHFLLSRRFESENWNLSLPESEDIGQIRPRTAAWRRRRPCKIWW